MRKTILVSVVAVALAVVVAPAFANEGGFERSYPLRAGGTFALSNVNGSVQVEGWERDLVEIRAVKSARRGRDDLDRVRIEVEATADSVAVRTRYPEEGGIEVSVDYRVRVPYRVLLRRVETVNGSVRVRGVDGSGELRSVNGNVELLDGAGQFNARTTNGNIRLELRRLTTRARSGAKEASMSVETVNGSIVLALPADAKANLDVRSLNGDFHSEIPLTVEGTVDSHGFRGRLGQGGDVLRIRTVNGGIRVVTVRPTV